MEVSLIIPVYNAISYLPQVLPPLLEQDFAGDWECILVDDSSTDGSLTYLRSHQLPSNFRIIENRYNHGRAHTRNQGIKKARGQILIFLDADMVVQRDFISTHVQGYQEKTALGFVGNITRPPERKENSFQHYLYHYPRRGARQFGPEKPLEFRFFVFGNASLKREVITQAGVFDEQIKYGEDVELAYRLFSHYPNRFFYLPKAVSYHLGHEDLNNFLQQMYHYGHDNLPYIISKHPEIAPLLAANLVEKINWRKDDLMTGFRKLAARFATSQTIINHSQKLADLLPPAISKYLIRICVVGTVLKGYKDFIREQSLSTTGRTIAG